MADHEAARELASVETAYLTALGRAVYAFAALEAQAVGACERVAPGSTRSLQGRTAGNVADKLIELAETMFATPGQIALLATARTFGRLVRLRNALVHARPGRDAAGRALLVHQGDPWTIAEFEEASVQFGLCAAQLRALLESFLHEPPSAPDPDPFDADEGADRDELFDREPRERRRRR